MTWPTITAGYLAVLALIYAALAVNVIRLRAGGRTPFGDGGDTALRNAIRAHANFAEYVPMTALMVALLEMSGASPLRVHLWMAGLLLSRLVHPLGLAAKPGSPPFRIFRIGGVTLTLVVLVGSAVTLLTRLVRGM
jgi:uncharacterized membrane protein YecN with MAPEG domain